MGFEPTVVYKDRRAALEWLQSAFGFEVTLLVTAADGTIGTARMSFAGSDLWIAEEDDTPGLSQRRSPLSAGGLNTQSVEVNMAAGIDEHFERARQAGANITQELADQFYGARTYRATDVEGHVWTFLQHIPMSEDAMTSRGLTVQETR